MFHRAIFKTGAQSPNNQTLQREGCETISYADSLERQELVIAVLMPH